jgi:tetratricopeptide (TPR) repeat protein
MLYRAHKLLSVLFACLALVVHVGAQSLDNQTLSRIERETTRLLMEKNVGEAASQLAREPAPTAVVPLLKRLTIFARAGHRASVLQTINQLAEASDLPPVSHRWLVAEAVKEIIGHDDLAALRAYYERLMPADAGSAEYLVRLWEKEGERKELDAWLAARAAHNVEWIRWRIYWRAKLGTIEELLNELAGEVKANPADRVRLSLYLQANDAANKLQDVSWLAAAVPSRLAYESYELGLLLKADAPESAVRLFEQSLKQPFTEQDMALISERIIRLYSMTPRVSDWEKQLRFWTKRQLAELYRATNRTQAAQALVEELVAMKDDKDIMAEDMHQLAGAVQAQSGMRVVEAKILNDEAPSRESASYWLERARYYTGRKEYDAVMEAYRQALASVPLKPQDRASVAARLNLLNAFTLFAASRYSHEDGKDRERRAEIKQVLRREFAATPPDTAYAFGVARIIVDDEFEFEDLRETLFVRDKDTLQRMLAGHTEWMNEHRWLITSIVCRDSLSPAVKAHFWTQLEALTKKGAPSRAFYLADAMLSCSASRRAVPLLVSYLKQTREQHDDEAEFREEQAVSSLFSAYLSAGDWQAAEKLLPTRKDLTGRLLIYELSRIAETAAREGALSDAVRLWQMKANLDRRQLEGLNQLAATKAREPLRDFYVRMKKNDPLSSAPDAALKVLQ